MAAGAFAVFDSTVNVGRHRGNAKSTIKPAFFAIAALKIMINKLLTASVRFSIKFYESVFESSGRAL